jgi:hypothetical protein
MMNRICFASCLILTFVAARAEADCTNNPLSGSDMNALFSPPAKIICGRPGAAYPGGANSTDRWQEEHRSGGQLWDFKLGDNNPVDARAQVGTWSQSGVNLTHSYTGGPSYTWRLFLISGNTYSFCSGSSEQARGNVIPDPGTGCGGVYPP